MNNFFKGGHVVFVARMRICATNTLAACFVENAAYRTRRPSRCCINILFPCHCSGRGIMHYARRHCITFKYANNTIAGGSQGGCVHNANLLRHLRGPRRHTEACIHSHMVNGWVKYWNTPPALISGERNRRESRAHKPITRRPN